jgi:hypothetical protein
MLNIINNNVIEYVLNLYLDYEEDIIKLKQLYNFRFNIKKHFIYKNDYSWGNYCKMLYLNNDLIKTKSYYSNGNIETLRNYKNNHLHGK